MLEVSPYYRSHLGHQFLSQVCFSVSSFFAETLLMHWAHGIEDTDAVGVVG